MKLSFTPPCLLLFLYSSLPSNEQHGPLPGEHSWLVFRVSYWWDRAGLSWMQLFLHRGSLWLGDAGSCQAWGSLWGFILVSEGWKLVGNWPWWSNPACAGMAAGFRWSPSDNSPSTHPGTPQAVGRVGMGVAVVGLSSSPQLTLWTVGAQHMV